MITVTRKIEWDAAHRVLRHESKCATLHGHRYCALITCTADELDDCATLVNREDHDLLAFVTADYMMRGKRQPYVFEGEPTAENIALQLLCIARGLLAMSGVFVVSVEVYETPNCSARAAD